MKLLIFGDMFLSFLTNLYILYRAIRYESQPFYEPVTSLLSGKYWSQSPEKSDIAIGAYSSPNDSAQASASALTCGEKFLWHCVFTQSLLQNVLSL